MNERTTTKERLLQGARTLFAEQGLSGATVRNICAQAGANVAAVNYHFGSKEQLYLAVMLDCVEQENRQYPLDDGVSPESPTEDRLRAFVRGMLFRALGRADMVDERISRRLPQELLEPSPCSGELFERLCKPSFNYLRGIVAAMLPEADDLTVSRCAANIIWQCLVFVFAREMIARVSPDLALNIGTIQPVADFILQFSLGGMASLRANTGQRIQKRPGQGSRQCGHAATAIRGKGHGTADHP